MKKYLLILATVFTLGAVLTGCGAAEKEKEEVVETPVGEDAEIEAPEAIVAPSLDDVDLSKIVVLGEYKGMDLERKITPVSAEAIDAQINSFLLNTPVEDEDGVVDDGDVANIDYEGKLEGVPFERGSDQDFDLRIGSGGFVPGFEEKLIGAKKGETLDINVTFPEQYSEELGGKDVVFTVTVNDVKRVLEEPNDELIANNTEYQTVEEFKQSIEDEITEYNEQMASQELSSQALEKLVAEAEIKEYPEAVLEYGKKIYQQSVQEYADYAGQTIEESLAEYGMTMDEYEEEVALASKDIAKQMLVMNAVAQNEGLKEGDAVYDEMLTQLETESQIPKEQLIEQYGEDIIKQNVLIRFVQKIILDNAKITDVIEELPDSVEVGAEAALEEDSEVTPEAE